MHIHDKGGVLCSVHSVYVCFAICHVTLGVEVLCHIQAFYFTGSSSWGCINFVLSFQHWFC